MTAATPISEPLIPAPPSTPASSGDARIDHSVHVNVSAYASSIVLTALPISSVATIDVPLASQYLLHMWDSLAPLLQLLQRCEPVELRPLSREHGTSQRHSP